MGKNKKSILKHVLATISIAIVFCALCIGGVCASVINNLIDNTNNTITKIPVNILSTNSGFSSNKYVIIDGKAYKYTQDEQDIITNQDASWGITFNQENTLELIFMKDSAAKLSSFAINNNEIASVLQATKTEAGIEITITDEYDSVNIQTSQDSVYTLHNLALCANAQLNYANNVFSLGTKKGSVGLTAITGDPLILSLTGGTFNFSGNKTYSPKDGTIGRAIDQSGGTLNITDIVLDGFSSSENGGALYVLGGTANLNCTITGCSAINGGAVYNAGTLNVGGGTYNENVTTQQGGAIYSTGTTTISGATMSSNTATTGGGAFVQYGGTATLTNATMQNNVTTKNYGHAFYADNGAVVTVNSGTYATQNSSFPAATVIAGKATINLVDGTFKGYNYAFDSYSVNGANACYVLKGNPTIEATSGNHFWLNSSTYLRVETSLTKSYTVVKGSVTSFDDGDTATSYIAYSATANYLTTAQDKLTVSNYQSYHQHSTSLKTNYLVCEYKSYTASFNGNGGSNGASITKKYKAALGTLPTSTRTGYTQNGWWTATSDGTQITAETTMPSNDATYYAHWTANVYKVTLNNQSATSAGTTEYYYQYNTTKVINGVTCYYYTTNACTTGLKDGYYITCPSKTGYTFGGYYTSTNGGGTQYVNASGGCINNLYTSVAANSTLYAKWTANVYKVTLDNQGATSAGTTEYYYQYNTTKVISGVTCYYYTTNACTTGLKDGYYITCPAKTGYTFGGYYTSTNGGGTQYVNASGSCVNNLYTNVAANSTLYAKWTANTYTITYDANGGTISSVGTTNYTIEDDIVMPIAGDRPGYTFGGWKVTTAAGNWVKDVIYTNGETIDKGKYGSPTLTAQWSVNSYTLHVNTGANNLFNLSELATSKVDYAPSGSKNAKYSYDAKTMTLTYTSTAADDPYVPLHITANLTAGITYYFHLTALNIDGTIPTETNWGIFWALTSASFTGTQYFGCGVGDCYGSFTPTTSGTYKFRLDEQNANEGTWVISNLWIGTADNFYEQSVNYGSTTTLTVPTWAGHTFVGWQVFGSGSVAGNDVTMGVGNTTVSARWETNYHKVSIGVNNSSYGYVDITSVSVPYGSAISSSGDALTVNGTTITATPTSATGYTTTCTSWTNGSGSVLGDITITANFTRVGNIIKITLNVHEEVASTDQYSAIYYRYGTNAYYIDCIDSVLSNQITTIFCPSRPYYDFQGYYTQENGLGVQYTNGGELSSGGEIINDLYLAFTENTTLYDYYTPINYTINYACYYDKTHCTNLYFLVDGVAYYGQGSFIYNVEKSVVAYGVNVSYYYSGTDFGESTEIRVTRDGLTKVDWNGDEVDEQDVVVAVPKEWLTTGSTSILEARSYLSAYDAYDDWEVAGDTLTSGPVVITLDKQGGSGGLNAIYYVINDLPYYTDPEMENYIGNRQMLSSQLPTRTGHTFNGYYTATSGGNQYVDEDGVISSSLVEEIDTDTTLYAQWTPLVYTVKFEPYDEEKNITFPESHSGIISVPYGTRVYKSENNIIKFYYNGETAEITAKITTDYYDRNWEWFAPDTITSDTTIEVDCELWQYYVFMVDAYGKYDLMMYKEIDSAWVYQDAGDLCEIFGKVGISHNPSGDSLFWEDLWFRVISSNGSTVSVNSWVITTETDENGKNMKLCVADVGSVGIGVSNIVLSGKVIAKPLDAELVTSEADKVNTDSAEVWLDDKFRKLQEIQSTKVDFEGISFST